MKVLFAPDWRAGVPYQSLLGEALAKLGVEVLYPNGFRRGLPITRGPARAGADLVHLHWPEAYYPYWGGPLDGFRVRLFPIDFWLARRYARIVTTAHNLLPHERPDTRAVFRNQRHAYCNSAAVFAHSDGTARQLVEQFGVEPERIVRIPMGDLSAQHGRPPGQDEARARLGLSEGPVCLMIGAVRQYKGIEEVLDYWVRHAPSAKLIVVGRPEPEEYGRELLRRAQAHPQIDIRLGWLSDEDFRVWLGAADCVLFNYRRILTSGGAPVARACGVPLLIPRRLDTVDLGEPNARVFRFDAFETDFATALGRAMAIRPDWHAARDWRDRTTWSAVAAVTAAAYRRILAS